MIEINQPKLKIDDKLVCEKWSLRAYVAFFGNWLELHNPPVERWLTCQCPWACWTTLRLDMENNLVYGGGISGGNVIDLHARLSGQKRDEAARQLWFYPVEVWI